MTNLTKEYNHNLSKKLVEKANYENELQDEIENFDLLKWLELK